MLNISSSDTDWTERGCLYTRRYKIVIIDLIWYKKFKYPIDRHKEISLWMWCEFKPCMDVCLIVRKAACWKWNFPMSRSVRLSVGRLIGHYFNYCHAVIGVLVYISITYRRIKDFVLNHQPCTAFRQRVSFASNTRGRGHRRFRTEN